MISDQFHTVVKTEVHALHLCGCNACKEERDRREQKSKQSSRLVSIRPSSAYALGIISRLSSKGSLAREIASK